jgi:hypothetical protein
VQVNLDFKIHDPAELGLNTRIGIPALPERPVSASRLFPESDAGWALSLAPTNRVINAGRAPSGTEPSHPLPFIAK